MMLSGGGCPVCGADWRAARSLGSMISGPQDDKELAAGSRLANGARIGGGGGMPGCRDADKTPGSMQSDEEQTAWFSA